MNTYIRVYIVAIISSFLFANHSSAADVLPQDNWSLVYTNSQHPGYEAIYAFDGDPNTLWHTDYNNPIPHSHEIRISLGGLYSISGFRYLPRQDDTNARIKQYAFYASTDGINWGTPVATGTFPNSAAEQQVLFTTPTPAAFIRLVALSSNDGSDLSTVGELNVLGDPGSVGNQAPIGSIASPTADRVINIGDTLDFTATATDPDGNLPLSYQWNFGAGSGVPNSTDKDPHLVQFNNAGTYTVTFTVTDANGLSDPTPATRLVTVQSGNPAAPLPQDNWSLVYTNSQHPGYEAIYAFDGDPNTIWHTNYDNPIPHPHEIQISLGGLYSISGFRYLPRQDDTNARIKQYAFYASTDGINWGTPVATGTFPNSAAEQQVLFTTPTPAAFIRLVALSSNDGSDLSTVGELNVLGDPGSVGNQAPIGSIASPTADRVINIGDTLDFTATATDPDGNLPLSYQWNFGAGSGVPNSTDKDPHLVQFNNAGTYTVTFTVTDANGLSDPTPATRLVTVQSGNPAAPLPQDNWSLVYTNSQHPGYEANYAFDGNPNTLWHTDYNNPIPHSHEIRISLGGLYSISGFRYLPRQDDTNARISQYAFYASTDGINWGTPVATGTFPNSAAEQQVLFTPTPAAFIRLVALSSNDGSDLSTVGELNVLGDLGSFEILDCSVPDSQPQIDDDFDSYNIGQNLDTQSPLWEYACEHFSNDDHSVVCDHGGTETGDNIIGHAACSDGITNGAGCSTYTAESYSFLKVCAKLDVAEVTNEYSALLIVDAAEGGDENDDGYYLDLRLPGRLALRTKPTDAVLAANDSVNYGEGDMVCLAFWDNAGTRTLTGTLNGAVAVEATDGLVFRGPFYTTVFISRDQRDLTLVNGFDDFGVAECGTNMY